MNTYKSAYSIGHALLSKYDRNEVNSEIIESEIRDNILKMSGFQDLDVEELKAHLESDFGVNDFKATQLVGDDVKPWLYKTEIDFKFWDRYLSFLRVEKPFFPVVGLNDKTHQILDNCVNPKRKTPWDRRGMVVGNVQSGKTANYTGLINKAMDAGYKMIIVMAGMHNTLRAQTQDRIDEGVIGRKSVDLIQKRPTNKYGVGFYSSNETRSVYSYTSTPYLIREGSNTMRHGDFDINKARELNVPIGGTDPTVLVIKKNKTILENLILWLEQWCDIEVDGERKISDVPLLLIDDEADNASVNSGDKFDIKTINRLIRTLLNMFSKSTFIGYTATPYANIYIPEDWDENVQTSIKGRTFQVGPDLFPKDFIVNIHPPSNYIGASQVFGFENALTGERKESLDLIRIVKDQEPCFPKKLNKDNKDDLPEDVADLPTSLKKAVKSFILGCAIKGSRGMKKEHSSMLVHVALYVHWIDRVAFIINELLHDYKNQIKSGQGPLLAELKNLYEKDFRETTRNITENLSYTDPKIKEHSWEQIENHLKMASNRIEVRAVHGRKKNLEYDNFKELNYNDYDDGLYVIAVGGNKLSRGITLEGLTVSYYLRTTKMYDSLMQMGRWFGYRPGYVDLCRLFTTEEIRLWYRHVAMATEDMRADFDEMFSLRMKPTQYQLKVMSHPGMLSITATNKMKGHKKLSVGYSGRLVQTYSFSKSQEYINQNYQAFQDLTSKLNNPQISEHGERINELLFRNVSAKNVMDFISSYLTDQPLRLDTLVGYIELQNTKGNLEEWDVAIISNSQLKVKIGTKTNSYTASRLTEKLRIDNEKYEIGYPVRNLEKVGNYVEVSGNKMAILDKRARMIGLDLDPKKKYSEDELKEVRSKLKQPLLVIYPLDPRVVSKGLKTPIVGWGIAFPKIKNELTYEYALRPIEDLNEEMHEGDENEDIDD